MRRHAAKHRLAWLAQKSPYCKHASTFTALVTSPLLCLPDGEPAEKNAVDPFLFSTSSISLAMILTLYNKVSGEAIILTSFQNKEGKYMFQLQVNENSPGLSSHMYHRVNSGRIFMSVYLQCNHKIPCLLCS